MAPKHPQNQQSEYERLIAALGVKTQREAALMLGVPQSSLSDCKRRGGQLGSALVRSALAAGISARWILQGVAPMREEKESGTGGGSYCSPRCPAAEALTYVTGIIQHCEFLRKTLGQNGKIP